MLRIFLSLSIVAAQLIAADVGFSRPPDEVVNSPIPPIKAPVQRKPIGGAERPLTTPTPRGLALGINLGPQQPVASPQAGGPQIQTGMPQDGTAHRGPVREQNGVADAKVDNGDTQYYSTSASELWNSPPMCEARDGVLDFSRRSAQTSPAEGEQFLSRLSQSSLEEMKSWLGRYQARQADLSFGRDVEKMARQLMLENAIDRQEARRRAYENVSHLRDQVAAEQEQYAMEQAQVMEAARALLGRTRTRGLGPIYNPLEPVFDPMSPQGYRRRVAAAMSLPGDLPRNDPRNFIRGDAGIDTGDWATSRDAEPPIPAVPAGPVAPAPAAPAAAAPAGD